MPLPRTAQLGLLAKDLAVLRLSSAGEAKARARQRLVERLGLLHGLPQKIGQLLAFSEIDAADPAFTKLTENEPALTAAEARAEVERQLGGPLEEFFATFEPQGIAASIGQVHRATLHDGRTVAVKLQLPGIAAAVEHDLDALGWLTAPVGDLRRGFDLKAYRAEIGNSLRRELDYREEASALVRFSTFSTSLPHQVASPALIPALCREHLLVTTWLYGDHLSAARDWPVQARTEISASLLALFFHGLLDWGFLHADPHPGNYRFLHRHGRPTVGLLDFGCIKTLPPHLRAGLRRLFQAAATGSLDASVARQAFGEIGFPDTLLDRLGSRLTAVATALTEPFANPGVFDHTCWSLGEKITTILGEDRLTFRTAGPPELIFILRAFSGLLHYLNIIAAPTDWHAALPPSVLTGQDNPPAPITAVPPPRSSGLPFPPPLSQTLHLHVTEHNELKVALTFDATAAECLPSLVPDHLLPLLTERGIDLGKISAAAQRSQFAPGELFTLHDGPKHIRIWLE